jgi:GTP-binding protein
MVRGYLRGRPTLKRVCVLVDSRHGLKDIDLETMAMLDAARVPYAVVLTKADKLKPPELEAVLVAVEDELKSHPVAVPRPYPTSAEKKQGIAELRAFLAEGARF